jgi:hypothetical protein
MTFSLNQEPSPVRNKTQEQIQTFGSGELTREVKGYMLSQLPAVIQTARDLTILVAAIYFLTELKPLTESARDFFKRATAFMESTEQTMSVIQSNHLKHIQAALETLVKKENQR